MLWEVERVHVADDEASEEREVLDYWNTQSQLHTKTAMTHEYTISSLEVSHMAIRLPVVDSAVEVPAGFAKI